MEDNQKEDEQERGKETWWSQGFVSRVPVYLFLLWVARALYTLDGLSRFLFLTVSVSHIQTGRFQAAAGQEKKTKTMKTKRKKEMQEEEYGRNCRRRPPRLITMQACDTRSRNSAQALAKEGKREEKKRRNIKNTNKNTIYKARE